MKDALFSKLQNICGWYWEKSIGVNIDMVKPPELANIFLNKVN